MKLTLSPDTLALNPDYAQETKPSAKKAKPTERRNGRLPEGDTFPKSYFQYCPFTCPEHGVYLSYGVSQWTAETGNVGRLVFTCGCEFTRPIKARG